jgi:uncharacterized OsmC-like protein
VSQGKRTVESTWQEGLRCEVEMGEFKVTVDEPENVGGTNLGAQPTDLFLASIASCFTLAVAYGAAKRSITIDHLAVTATGTYDGPRFCSININTQLICDSDDVASLIQAAERVCYVTNTLRSDDLTINVTIATT